jgi:two-component system cell cycle sensor histidine kinase/response regulator CckA
MMMPEGISGWELAEKLQAERPGLKVIYTSGYSVDLLGRNGEFGQGIHFLPKPYQPHVLAKTVRDCLDG